MSLTRLKLSSTNKSRIKYSRLMALERLELRQMLNVDWRNPLDNLDVTVDGIITPSDALQVINYLNSTRDKVLPEVKDATLGFIDTTGDGRVSPSDALLVINRLNSGFGARRQLSDSADFSVRDELDITLGQSSGTRIYRLQIDAGLAPADGGLLADTFSVFVVDPSNESQTLLNNGVNSSPIFTLSSAGADLANGLARWNGSVLEIDTGSIQQRDTARLRFQLINGNNRVSSSVLLKPLNNQPVPDIEPGTWLDLEPAMTSWGAAVGLSQLTVTSEVTARLGYTSYSSTSGIFEAELSLTNQGNITVNNAVVVVGGLPPGVSVVNPSGLDSQGRPYLSFKPSIAGAGLGKNQKTAPIRFRISNPGNRSLDLSPVVLIGENRAPVLDPIPAQDVIPGQTLTLPLTANDPDGDALRFSFVGGSPLPKLSMSTDGTLTVQPTPSQLGTYQLVVQASDGALADSETITIRVLPDPVGTTRLSGRILNVDGSPIAGLPVEVGTVSGLTTADGRFTLNLGMGIPAAETLRVRGELLTGPLKYPFIAEKLPFMLQHEIYAGYNNVIVRPIYLPTLNPGSAVDPNTDVTVSRGLAPNEAAAEVLVRANTLFTQQGAPFTGALSITEVPPERTPAALPPGLRTDLVVTIQPGEMNFASPAPLSLPNRSNLPAGSPMDLWSINPVTGEFERVGGAVVSDDGKSVTTVSGGIRNSSWHFFSPEPDVNVDYGQNPRNQKDDRKKCPCARSGATSEVELSSGALVETHSLTSYQSMGIDRSLVWSYDSKRADPRPIVHVGYANVRPGSDRLLMATVDVERDGLQVSASGYERRPGDNYGLSGGENFWKIPAEGGNVNGALQVDLSTMPTGIYQVRIHQGLMSFANDRVVGSTTEDVERLVHVNGIGSPFGNGWGMAGLQQLFQESNGDVLIVDGDGGDGDQLAYSRNQDGSYTSTPGDYSTLTKLVGGIFQRRETDGTIYEFEPSGLLTSVRDRIGNTTRYEYSTGTIRRLNAIVDPVGLRTNFTYANGRVSSVTDPANRTTRFDYDTRGNLIRITDPDNTFRTWDYDSGNRMVGETDKRGAKESATYHFSGRVIGATRKDGSRIEVQPLQLQGLYPPERTSSPINPPDAYRALTVESLYLDSNGNWTKTTLDDRGQELSSRDSVGRKTQTVRDAQNQVTSTIDARGHVTHYRYDDRGNLISRRDEISSSSRLIEAVLSNPAEIDEYVFTAKPGQRLIVDGLGSTDSRAQISISGDFAPYAGQTEPSSNGNLLNTFDYGVYVFPRGGEFKIRISASLSSSGPIANGPVNYRFRLLDLSNAIPIESDAWIEGRNEFAGGTTLYQFQGVAGQELAGQWRSETSNSWLLLGPSLQDANGNSFINGGQLSNITTTLPVTGTYWIFVRGSDANIPYSFRLVAPQVFQASYSLGTFSNATLARFGNRAEYTFAGTIGQLVLINQTNASFDVKQDLISPSGAPSTSWTLANPQLLRETGTYRYRITSNAEDEIEAAFQILNLATAKPLPLGADTLATITRPLEAAAYRFTAAAGDRLAVEDLSDVFGVFPAEFKLFDAQGQEVFTSRTGWDQTKTFTLAFAGEYYLVGKSTSADVAANIRFRASLATSAVFETTLGSTLTGTLSRYADRHEYRFNASAGMNVQFDTPNTAFYTELISPSGAVHPSPSKVELLSESGAYRLRITRDARLGEATYSMRLLNADTLPAQPLNALITVTASSSQPAILRWNATAGMHLKYELLGANSGYGQWISPLGRELGGDRMVASVAGNYFLVIYSNQSQAESIQVRVTDISGGLTTSSGLNRRITGTLAGDAFIDFPIRSSAGVRVAIEDRSDSSGFNPTSIELVDRDGNLLNTNIFHSGRLSWVEIPNSSESRIRIRNGLSSNSDYDYYIHDLTSVPLLSLGSYAEGNLAANESRIWRIALTAGRTITVDRDLSVTSNSQGISLYRPDASFINGTYGRSAITLTGEYFVVAAGLSTSSSYAFRLLDSSSATSLTLNQDVNATTNRPSQKLQYRFEMTAAQLLSLDFLNQFTPVGTWSVSNMSGATIASGGLQPSRFSVTTPGSYLLTLDLRDATPSTLSFRLSPARTFARSLGFGATETVTFERMGDAFQYTFNLVAGDQVLLDSLSGFGVSEVWTNANGVNASEFQSNFWSGEQLTTVLRTGTYTLTLRPSSMDVAGGLTYSFRLLRGNQGTSITTDTNNSVVLDPPSASQLFRFSGTAGQSISFSRASSVANVKVSLYSPFASIKTSAWQDFEALLPITGTYVLAISNSSFHNEPIEFRLSIGSESTTSIQWNQLVSGSVAGVADRAYYLIPGTVGQRAMLLPETDNGHRYQLFAPSGRLLRDQSWSSPVLIDEFVETGSYRLVVQRSAAVGANPNFQFRLLDLPTTNPVPDGQEFTVSFPTGKDAVIVPVSMPAPNGLEVRVVGTGTDLVSMSWFEAGEQSGYSIGNALGAQRISSEANQGWLLLRGRSAASLQLRLVVASIVIEDKSMSVGNPLTGTLSQIAIEHRYRLPVAAFTSLYVERLPTTTSELTIEGANPFWPSGDGVLYAEKPAQYDFRLAHTSGESSTSTPSSYAIRVSRLTDLPITPVGSTLTALVGQSSFSSLARMRVTTSQRVRLRQTSGPDSPVPILYTANGEAIAGTQGVFYLPAATDVWVVIRGNSVNPSSVSFAVESVSESSVTESGLDTIRSLVIPAGQQRALEFVARIGDRVFVELPQSISGQLSYEVTYPSGDKRWTDESILIEQSGTYQVTFRNFFSDINSSVVFRKESSLPTLAMGTWLNLDSNSNVRNQFLRVDVQPGGLYWFDIESSATFSTAFAQSWLENSRDATLLPDGSLLQIGSSRTLTLQLQWGENQPATRIRLLNLASAATLEFDSLTVERIGPNQFDARTYKFEGQRGERVRFENTTEARFFPTNSYLISPTGEIVTSSNAQRSWEATLPESGTYFIVIDGSIPSSEDYRFQLLRGTSNSSNLQVSSSGNAGNAEAFAYESNFSVMTSAIDEVGRRTEYIIDPANGNTLAMRELGAVDDPISPRITSYTYNALGLVLTETDPLGRLTEHEYDTLGRRTRTTFAVGTPVAATTRWEYNASGNVTAMVDPLNRRTEYTYDALNRLSNWKQPDPDGPGPALSPITSFQYDAHGNLLRLTDPLLRVLEISYDVLDRAISQKNSNQSSIFLEYDPAGNLRGQVDELGRRTTYQYDSRNRLVEIVNPIGGRTLLRYNNDDHLTESQDPLGRITRFEYDARGRSIRVIDPLLGVQTTEYDPADQVIATKDELGRTTSYVYNPFGELISVIDALGGVSQAEYDAAGNPIRLIDAANKPTTIVYDAQNRISSITDAIGGQKTVSYDLVGNIVRTEDELRRATTFEYDALNRRIRATDALNGLWSFQFDAVGNLLAQTDARNSATTFAYDALDRLVLRTTPDNSAEKWFYDAKGNLTAQEDEEGRRTTLTYDPLDRLIESRDPLQNLVSYSYDAVGNMVTFTDGLRKTTRREFDRLDRLTKTIDPRNGETKFEYDAVGNRTSLIDPVQNKTTFTYDALNRLTHETNVLGKALVWEYDSVGNVTDAIDRNGRTRKFLYDDLHRNTHERWLDGSGATIRELTWSYDAASQLLSAADPDSRWSFSYDVLGRVTSSDNQGTPISPRVQFAYGYDANSNPTGRTDRIAGAQVGSIARTFDTRNRVSSIQQNSGGAVNRRVDFEYDKSGLFKSLTRYRDAAGQQQVAKSTYSYDSAARLQQIKHASIDQVLATYDYTWDAADRITRIASPDGTANYSYDVTDQLTGADHSAQADENYAYDLNGNRTMSGYRTGANNRLESDGKYNYSYDDNGNRTLRVEISSGQQTEYSWDYRNRLTSVIVKNSSGAVQSEVRYAYDIFDRRIRKSIDADGAGPGVATIKQYVHDGDHVAFEFDGAGNLTHRYLHGPVIDMVLADEQSNGDIYWMLTDHLGTVRDIVDSNGVVRNHLTYDSFGRILVQSNASLTPTFAYTGREWDPETGMFQYRARYYDPVVGRFVSEDPIRFAGLDTNLKRYVGNHATTMFDPSGESGASIVAKGIVKLTIRQLKDKLIDHLKKDLAERAIKKGFEKQAKRLFKELEEAFAEFEKVTSFDPSNPWDWAWEAAEFLPAVGDAVSCGRLGKAFYDLTKKIDNIRDKARKVVKPETRQIKPRNISKDHPTRKEARDKAAHAHKGKPRNQPPKTASADKRKAFEEQTKYKYPERHPDSKHPGSHYHDSNKSKNVEKGKPNIHHRYPKGQ